jgi:hypothetical protein
MTPTLEQTPANLYELARQQEREQIKEEVLSQLMADLKPLRELVTLQVGLLESKDVMRILRIDRKTLQNIKPILKPIHHGVRDLYSPDAVLTYIHKNMGKRTPGRGSGREARKRLFELRQR